MSKSHLMVMQSKYSQTEFGEYLAYPDSMSAGDGLGWDGPDLISPTWSNADYALSPISTSSNTFYSPTILQDGNQFEGGFGGETDTIFAGPNMPWSFTDKDPILFEPSETLDYPAIPSPVGNSPVSPAYEPSTSTKSNPGESQPVSNSREYKPAWTTAAADKRAAKRAKQSPRNSQSSKSKSPRSTLSDSDSGSNNRGRRNHNLTEKKYRNRLNGQFETLLQALPPAPAGDNASGSDGPHERRISKAEVLILAKEHIEALERQKAELESQKNVLSQDLEKLKGAWTSLGGDMMP
ncbi:hypothetical protein B0J14DRAFT_304312 [Halenospora varia]|nr:hypothetical protein B0J14DRAFT_304312 [Halenospora varia]